MKIVNKQSRDETIKLGLGFLIAIALIVFLLLAMQPGPLLSINNLFWRSILLNSTGQPLPNLIIDMPFDQYNRILDQREQALDQGVVIASNNDFVRADIRFQDETVPVELRLQQGIADHLEDGDKWNFDGRTRNDQLISGMQRFYLIDPAYNNWVHEVAFAESLKMEGLLAGQYLFVRLFLNGEDRGIYALQEGFGQEIMKSNGVGQGVIVEFDSTPLWSSIVHHDGNRIAVLNDPISNLSASEFPYFQIDAFRDAAIVNDPELTRQKNQAIGLLRGLQSGELKASEVFDIEKYGRFLALADLWGAIDATSLVDLRYYFNPASERLEPIGFNGNPLSSDRRLDLAVTYDDFALQETYIEELQRVVTAEYLQELKNQIDPDLQRQVEAISSEIEVQLPWVALQERQAQIGRSLTPMQPVLAFLGSPELAQEGIIQVDIANALNVPVQILGFNIDGATFIQLDPDWIQHDPANAVTHDEENLYLNPSGNDGVGAVRYVRVHIPLTQIISQDSELDFMHELDVQVATRLAGLENVIMVSAQTGYPDPILLPQN